MFCCPSIIIKIRLVSPIRRITNAINRCFVKHYEWNKNMCFHIGKLWQIHSWYALTIKSETKGGSNENSSSLQMLIYLPICSRHSMFYHSRTLPPSSPLFKPFSSLGSKGNFLIELNLFNAFKSYIFVDSFIV